MIHTQLEYNMRRDREVPQPAFSYLKATFTRQLSNCSRVSRCVRSESARSWSTCTPTSWHVRSSYGGTIWTAGWEVRTRAPARMQRTSLTHNRRISIARQMKIACAVFAWTRLGGAWRCAVVLIPCGQLVVCQSCSSRLPQCSICRAVIRGATSWTFN